MMVQKFEQLQENPYISHTVALNKIGLEVVKGKSK
jgi:hypothetical protein